MTHTRNLTRSLGVLALAAGALVVGAINAPSAVAQSAAPAPGVALAAPATQAYVPRLAVVPPGFHDITVGGTRIFCDPADDAWVKQGVAAVGPVTRPTTMPDDLLGRVQLLRGPITTAIMQDMALTDQKPVDAIFDDKANGMLIVLNKLINLKPPVIFMPVSRAKLAVMLQAGWSDPHFRYNRFAGDVEHSNDIALSIDHPMDDTVMWVEIKDTDSPKDRAAALAGAIHDFQDSYGQSLSVLVQGGIRNVFSDFIYLKVMEPMGFPLSTAWFPRGIAGVYGIKYTTMLTGSSRADLENALSADDPQNPLSGSGLDLIHPLDPAGMHPELIPLYDQALMRKSAAIVNMWVKQGGDGVVAKTLPVLRPRVQMTGDDKKTPVLNISTDELLKTIQTATGIDLTPALLPNYHVAVSTQPAR
jgi:hypothetical protein